MADPQRFRTVYRAGKGEITEKKSRFLGFLFPVSTEEEIETKLNEFRKTYWDARHVCFAYVLHGQPPQIRFSDDGEPSGTAGKPMLELLTRESLENVLLIVVRYFGGVLLGTGGLVRAYTDSSRAAIDGATLITKEPAYLTEVRVDYGLSGRMPYMLADLGIATVDIQYSDAVTYLLPVPTDRFDAFRHQMVEATSGGVVPEPGPLTYFAMVDGECVLF